MLTIIWTSYTLKQKRYKIIIKRQNQADVLVNKIFNKTKLLTRKALSMTFIQCSLRRFVIFFQNNQYKVRHHILCKHILIFYQRNHIAFGLYCFMDNAWCHYIKLLLERDFHSIFPWIGWFHVVGEWYLFVVLNISCDIH